MKRLISRTKRISGVTSTINAAIAVYLNRLSKQNFEIRKQKLAVFANDWIGININLFGIYERDQLELIFDFLSPLLDTFQSGLALDIGANIGNHAVFFDRFFHATFAFEPNPAPYALLVFNSSYSKGIKAFNFGLGNVNGSQDLYETLENVGAGAFKRPSHGETATVPVSVRRLDDCQLDLGHLCFMKIDVEGSESDVIRGSLETIKRHQPVIVFEQLEREFQDGCSQAAAILEDLGYTLCWILNETPTRPWIVRRFVNILEVIFGKTLKASIVTDASLPVATYDMLIAVPNKYRSILGFAP